ncbi:B-cell receptor CD22-like [Lytechinus variegatus]|uniref:B-cell receptor CD22-like n=1 Tax=Lytechinus variegatus TaxID=7654 RepID=UPI001BB0FBA7|nr:B-cell receptor CD22-like [Lytechinus variegatus]
MWARPPAILKWRIPECVPAVVQDQSDVIQGNFYISRKTVTITPSRDNHGKILSCTASHPELEKELNCSVVLKVQVWPMNVLLFTTGGNQSHSTDIYVQEDSPTSITCKAIGSFPAVDLPVSFPYGSDIIPITNSSKTSSLFDEKLFDTDTTIKIYPKKTDHGKYIRCYAFMDSEVVGLESAKLMVYALPDEANINIPEDLHDGMDTNVTCRTSNGYPAPLTHWYIGSRNLTDNSSLKSSLNSANRYDTLSTLIFVPRKFDHGKRLLCQAVQPETTLGRPVNDSMVLNISYGPIVSITSRRLTVRGVHTGFVLKCTSDGNPPAFTFKWLCNGKDLSSRRNMTLYKTVAQDETVTSSELAIEYPFSEDSCDFKCIANSTYGSGTTVLNSIFYDPLVIGIKTTVLHLGSQDCENE